MINFKVTPFNGKYNAPSIYVQAKDEKGAVSKAKPLSRLSDFNSWIFTATRIN